MKSPIPTMSVRLCRPFGRALLARGLDPTETIRGLGIAPETFGDPDARVTRSVAMTILERALEVSGDPALGVHAAEHVHPGDFDALELVVRACGTRRAALAALRRYIGLMIDDVSITSGVEGDHEAWTIEFPPQNTSPATEFSIGILVLVGRSLSDGNENPDFVEIAYPEPAYAAECERVLGCKVIWAARRNALLVSTARLDRTIARITPSLSAALEDHVAKLLGALPKAATETARVRERIVEVLRTGPATAEEVCRHLKVSKRTLRRRLKDEGQTFSGLLSQVRRELAHRHVKDLAISLTEAAFLLGFSDTRAFQRAFRKWFGMSPSEYRNATPR